MEVTYRRKPNGRYEYLRICKCGDTKYISFKPKKDAICQKCSSKKLAENMHKFNVKKEDEKVRYWYFCPTCPSIRKYIDKRKSAFCRECSYGRHKKMKPYYFFDFSIMKCRTLTVTPKKLEKVKRNVVKKQPVKKTKVKRKKNSYSRNSNNINPLALEKVREKNRHHREEEAKRVNYEQTKQTKTDADLIAEFLKHKEPSVQIDTEQSKNLYYGEVYIKPSLEWA